MKNGSPQEPDLEMDDEVSAWFGSFRPARRFRRQRSRTKSRRLRTLRGNVKRG